MLSEKQILILEKIVGGADIYDHALANELLEIKRGFPDYIEITEPLVNGGDAEPYFGAILTTAGLSAISG